MLFAKLHPLLVHFTVGLLVSGAVFEIYGKIWKDETAAAAGWFNVRFGFWIALPVMAVGILGVMEIDADQKAKTILSNHILFALSTVGLFMGALLASRFRKRPLGEIIYFLFIFIGLACVIMAGFYGGELVHRFGLPAGLQEPSL